MSDREEVECPTCQGHGIIAIEFPEMEVPWRWLICRPCHGRGCDPHTEAHEWTPPPFYRWHTCRDVEELAHFACKTRQLAPAHPQDIKYTNRDQILYIAARRNKLRKEEWAILRGRLAKLQTGGTTP